MPRMMRRFAIGAATFAAAIGLVFGFDTAGNPPPADPSLTSVEACYSRAREAASENPGRWTSEDRARCDELVREEAGR